MCTNKKVHSVSNIVWPPVQEEPELPSACPLFYPPPSQVTIRPRAHRISESSDLSELENISKMEQYQYQRTDEMAFGSGQRSAIECAETIAETVDRQRLVETIIKSRTQSPSIKEIELIPQSENLISRKAYDQFQEEPNIAKESNISFPKAVQSERQKAPSKITNPVPKKWESQMLQALTISVDDSSVFTSSSNLRGRCSEEHNEPHEIFDSKNITDTFSDIPTKKTSTALGSALSVAPVEPFNPVKISLFDSVSLPEETVPYFPPEDLFVVPIKDTEDQRKVKPGKKKKDPNLEKLLDDLPKPQEKLSMRSALTTAPDRPFTPSSFQIIKTDETKSKTFSEHSETTSSKTVEKRESTKPFRPTAMPESLKINQEADLTPSPENLPLFQGFTCSFQNKTDHSKFDIQISTVPPVREKKSDSSNSRNKSNEMDSITKTETTETKNSMKESSLFKEKETKSIKKQDTKSTEKFNKNVIYKKPEQMITLRKPEVLPQYQKSVKENAEADIIMMERIEKAKLRKEQEKQKTLQALTSEIIQTEQKIEKQSSQLSHIQQTHADQYKREMGQSQQIAAIACPVIKVQGGNLHSAENSFKPVVESEPQSCTFSRPLTPSMINKPPPILPYYQANLVAQKYGPPTVNLLDPKSPAISRSPSPLPEYQKSIHSASAKSSNIRAKSPAQGPPMNPMHREHIPTRGDFKLEEAKDNINSFIPQYKEKREMQDELLTANSGKDSRNEQRNAMYTSDVVTGKESMPLVNFEAATKREEESFTSENQQNSCKLEESKLRHTADSESEEIRSQISGNTESTTKISEKSHLDKSEDFKKMENKSFERSADGSIQIQRKKTVTEEKEHTHKSEEIVIEKNVTSSNQQGFRNVKNPEEENHHVMGLHITAPNPIRSPFIKSAQGSTPPKLNTVCQKVGKDIPCKKNEECIEIPKKQTPIVPKFDATTLPQPKSVPEMTKTPIDRKTIPPKPIKHVDPPGSSKSNQKLNPNVPPTDVGAVGGRQTGAIGIAPKRGRGVLNSAQLGGRIPLCGQCHGQIRGPFITALGKIWCPNHFICATPSCRRPLQDMGFVEEQGQLYCEYCFEQYLAPICARCGSKIKGDCLKAIGKGFHPECFNCTHCGKLFGNTPFFLEDGMPYCEADWNEMFTTKCFACGFPVEAGDRWVEALNNNYHSQCFNCTMCKKNLEGQSFFAKGGRPYCKNHAR